MAAVKMNVLHWHLTEDQGFRVESKVFPKLHQLGSDGMYLHPGPDPGGRRLRGRPRHPGHARVRHPRPFDQLVRRLSPVLERAGLLCHRAEVRRLRPGLQSGRREDLSLLRRLLQGDGRALPGSLSPYRRRRGRRPPVGGQSGHPGLQEEERPRRQQRPPGLFQQAAAQDPDQARQEDGRLGRDLPAGPAERHRHPFLARPEVPGRGGPEGLPGHPVQRLLHRPLPARRVPLPQRPAAAGFAARRPAEKASSSAARRRCGPSS